MTPIDQLEFVDFVKNEQYTHEKCLSTRDILQEILRRDQNSAITSQVRNHKNHGNFTSYDVTYDNVKIACGNSYPDETTYILLRKLSEHHKKLPNFLFCYFLWECEKNICPFNFIPTKINYYFTEPYEMNKFDNTLTNSQIQSLFLQGLSIIRYCYSNNISVEGPMARIFTYVNLPEEISIPIYGTGKYLRSRILLKLLPYNTIKPYPKKVSFLIENFQNQFFYVYGQKYEDYTLLTEEGDWELPKPHYEDILVKIFLRNIELPYKTYTIKNIVDLKHQTMFDRIWVEKEFSDGLEVPTFKFLPEKCQDIRIEGLLKLFDEPKSIQKQKVICSVLNYIRDFPVMGNLIENFKDISFGKFGKVSIAYNNEKELLAFKNPLESNYEIYHENTVGQVLNKLRKKIPNFMYVYCTVKNMRQWCSGSCPEVLLVENIQNSVTLSRYIDKVNVIEDNLNFTLQMLNLLYLSYNRYKFCHRDTHFKNILIEMLDRKISIPIYDKNYNIICHLHTDKVVRLIDYGKSSVTYKGFVTKEFEKIKNLPPLGDFVTYLFHLTNYTNQKFFSNLYTIFTDRNYAFDLEKVSSLKDENLYKEKDYCVGQNGTVYAFTKLQDPAFMNDKVSKIMDICIQNLYEYQGVSLLPKYPPYESSEKKDSKYYKKLLLNL